MPQITADSRGKYLAFHCSSQKCFLCKDENWSAKLIGKTRNKSAPARDTEVSIEF